MQPHGQRVVPLVPRQLDEFDVVDPHLVEAIDQPLAPVGVDPVVQIIIDPLGQEPAGDGEIPRDPAEVQPIVDQGDPSTHAIDRELRIVPAQPLEVGSVYVKSRAALSLLLLGEEPSEALLGDHVRPDLHTAWVLRRLVGRVPDRLLEPAWIRVREGRRGAERDGAEARRLLSS